MAGSHQGKLEKNLHVKDAYVVSLRTCVKTKNSSLRVTTSYAGRNSDDVCEIIFIKPVIALFLAMTLLFVL